MSNFLATYLIDIVGGYAAPITVGILGALILAGVIVFLAKKDVAKTYLKYAFIGFFFYALIAGIFLLILDVIKHYDPAYLDRNYVDKDVVGFVLIPVLAAFCLVLVSVGAYFLLIKKRPETAEKVKTALSLVCLAAFVAALVLIAVYYSRHIADSEYYSGEYGELNSLMLYVSAAALIVVSVAIAFITGRKDKSGFDSRSLAFAGVSIALSFALSYVKLWKMPQGGSVTLVSCLPIMLFSFVYGAKKGLLVGLIYGTLQSVQDPFIVHPAQFLLDYPVAYALTGLAGCLTYLDAFEKLPQLKFALGAVIGAAFRFFSHVLSGVFAFGAYAKDTGATNLWAYSLAYNSVVFVDIALVIVAGIILFSSKSFNSQMRRFNGYGKN